MDTLERHHEHRRVWQRRVALWAGISLIAFELAYVIAANAILRTHRLDRWVTGATQGLFLKVESGWTVWPGRVHVKGVELRFEDYNVQFLVALDEGTVDIALWQLPAQTLHLTRVRATGVRYLLRHKVASAEGNERRLALYPRIPGYADPPLFVGPRTPPLADDAYDLWTIQLEDVDVAARELWFLEYRFTGKARAKGGFRLEPERDAQTDLCSLALDGSLRVGQRTVASKLVGWLHAQLDRHDPRRIAGAQIVTKLSVNTQLNADLPDLEFTDLYRSPGDVELNRGKGTLHVRAQLEHGAWQNNTTLRYQTGSIVVGRKSLLVAGPLVLAGKIVKAGRDATFELAATTPRLRLTARGSPTGIHAPEARAVHGVLGMSADLTRPIEQRSMKAQLTLEVPELRWLNHVLESESLFTDGSAQADVALRWSKGEPGGGTLDFGMKDARMPLAGNLLKVSGTGSAQLTYDSATQRGHVSKLEVELPLVAVAHEDEWKSLPGGLRARAERLTWQGEPPRGVQGRFTLSARGIDPFLPFVISSSILRAVAKAVVNLGETHAVVEFDRTPAAFELRIEEARSGDLRVHGILRSDRDAKDPCGRFFVHDPKFGIGVKLYRGETSLDLFVSPAWWRERPPTTTCGPDFDRPKAHIVLLADTKDT